MSPLLIAGAVVGLSVMFVVFMSLHLIGPTQVGLVLKRLGRKLSDDNPIAFKGEAGYQSELLMPGLRFKLWPIYAVSKKPWVQIPAGGIGVVFAQVGESTAIGAKTATYKKEFGNFADLRTFVEKGGQKGVQRPVLQPGTLLPMHPVAFVVLTRGQRFGTPLSRETEELTKSVRDEDLCVKVITPTAGKDVCGIVTTLEGPPPEHGAIASRIGGFADVEEGIKASAPDAKLIEMILNTSNERHNSYQDYQAFLDAGGRIGLQHDPVLYGSYTFNPFCVRLEITQMLCVEQGEVAVMKSYIGLPTEDTSGPAFKHGSIVRPGHRGLWQEALRTGKYAVNPHVYSAVIVPTHILTLNWADYSSAAHNLDKDLKPIDAKSQEGFDFSIDLQVQLHVPDTMAARVIARVGSMENLVNELMQGAVGNHFRNKLQGMQAVQFIRQRGQVQEEAEAHVRALLQTYEMETVGVLIQDVKLPAELTKVLKEREISNQQIATYEANRKAEEVRKSVEQARGQADMQADLVKASVGVDIETHNAEARKAQAAGEAAYTRETGLAAAAALEAEGLARATGYQAQVAALGGENTARLNIARALADSNVPIVPQVAGGSGGNLVESLIGLTLSEKISTKLEPTTVTSKPEANALPASEPQA
jgi:uncharacterized membrane protein YqiK